MKERSLINEITEHSSPRLGILILEDVDEKALITNFRLNMRNMNQLNQGVIFFIKTSIHGTALASFGKNVSWLPLRRPRLPMSLPLRMFMDLEMIPFPFTLFPLVDRVGRCY